MWIRRKVIAGSKIGRQIGYPTLNFHIGTFARKHAQGVYGCRVRIDGKEYEGALYLGPKMEDPRPVLELTVLNFSRQIYHQFVSFKVGKKIRGPMHFSSLEQLAKQIQKDLKMLYNG